MTTHQWYVTAQWYTWQNERGQLHRTPTGPAHAKTFGAATTACGLTCDSWTKFWHLPYLGVKGIERCRECDLVVACGSPTKQRRATADPHMVRRRSG